MSGARGRRRSQSGRNDHGRDWQAAEAHDSAETGLEICDILVRLLHDLLLLLAVVGELLAEARDVVLTMDMRIGHSTRTRKLRLLAGVLVGFGSWIAVGAAGFFVLRTTWPAYALAEPHKAYSLGMLFARLTVGVICTLAAGYVAARAAGSNARAAWWLGGLLLLLSTPVHLVEVWADYPVWYHFAYLLPLMPVTGAGGRLANSGR